jgi:hypothetical protein
MTPRLAPLLLVLLGGCKQDEGERCQIDRDCTEGLICCTLGRDAAVSEGICRTAADCLAGGEGEAEPPLDAAVDVPADTTPAPDGAADGALEPALDDAPAPDVAPDAGPDAPADALTD